MKLNDFDLNKIAVFMEVAGCGGVTKAAQKLKLTPSAVSQSIKHLEQALSVQLFEREGKKFILSIDGRTLFEQFNEYQQRLRLCLSSIKRKENHIKGHVRLGVFYGFSNTILAKFIKDFSKVNPEIEIDIIFGVPSELDRMLQYGRIDFSVNLFKLNPSHNLRSLPLTSDELWLVSASKPPARILDLNELKKAPFIDYYRKNNLICAWIAHHFGAKIRDVPIKIYASHSEMVVQLILQGVGIGIVASSIARPFVEVNKLHVIRGRSRQLVSPIWLKEQTGTSLDQAKSTFKERLLSFFSHYK